MKDDIHIKEAVKETAGMKLTIITIKHEGAVSKMEKLLLLLFSTAPNVWCIFGLSVLIQFMLQVVEGEGREE